MCVHACGGVFVCVYLSVLCAYFLRRLCFSRFVMVLTYYASKCVFVFVSVLCGVYLEGKGCVCVAEGAFQLKALDCFFSYTQDGLLSVSVSV